MSGFLQWDDVETILGVSIKDIQAFKYFCDEYNLTPEQVIDILKEVMYEDNPF